MAPAGACLARRGYDNTRRCAPEQPASTRRTTSEPCGGGRRPRADGLLPQALSLLEPIRAAGQKLEARPRGSSRAPAVANDHGPIDSMNTFTSARCRPTDGQACSPRISCQGSCRRSQCSTRSTRHLGQAGTGRSLRCAPSGLRRPSYEVPHFETSPSTRPRPKNPTMARERIGAPFEVRRDRRPISC